MHSRAGNGKQAPNVQVPAPKLSCFATQLGVQRVTHPQLGELCKLIVDSGDLQLEVHFPKDFATPIGTELVKLGSGVIVAKPGDAPT